MSLLAPVSALSRTRLAVPVPTVPIVARGRVFDLLDAASAHPVTLVTGGAGSGKTLAVADWTRRRPQPGPVIWVSLTHAESDGARLWATVLEAAASVLGPHDFGALSTHVGTDTDKADRFLASLGAQRVIVVLDDVHEIEHGSALGLLDAVLRHPPAGLNLVLMSRHDPPLSLHRLRVAGQLGEVRSADLAFTADEAGLLLAEQGIELPAPALDALMATTEGWVTGLRLASMTLASADDPAAAAAAFDGRDSRVAAYLMDELRGLDADRQQLITTICVADEICAPLAAILSDNPQAGTVLEALAADDLFMVRRGVGWYRMHQLVLQALRARLRVTRPELEAELHRRAARWFEGEWLVALRHAVDSRDWAFVGRLALRSSAVALYSADRGPLSAELDRIPARAASGNPELEIALAYAQYCHSDVAGAATFLDRAEAGLAGLSPRRRTVATLASRMLSSSLANRRGDADRIVCSAQEADRLISGLNGTTAPGWCANRGLPLGLWAVGELWAGRPRQALQLMERALVGSDSEVSGYSGVYWYGHVALAESFVGLAGRAADRALQALREDTTRWTSSREAGPAWLALATASVWQYDLPRAQEALARGTAANGDVNPFVSIGLLLLGTRYRVLIGDLTTARRLLADVDVRLSRLAPTCYLAAARTAAAVDLELAAGAPGRAAALLAAQDAAFAARADADPSFDARQVASVLGVPRGRVLLSAGRAGEVRGAVEPLLAAPGGAGAHAWLMVCLAEDALRHDSLASDALARALDAGAPEGVLRPFACPGARLRTMLSRHLDVRGTQRDFVERALATADGHVAVHPAEEAEPLTERELSVLAYLPTLRSNTEIADELGISVNTVKQHLKSIHRKLGVGARRDAVRVARRLDLLPPGPRDDSG